MEKEITLQSDEVVNCFSLDTSGRIAGMETDGGTTLESNNRDVILSVSWGGESIETIYSPLQGLLGYASG